MKLLLFWVLTAAWAFVAGYEVARAKIWTANEAKNMQLQNCQKVIVGEAYAK